MAAPAPLPTAEAILQERLAVDLRDGVAFLKRRLAERARERGGLVRLALPVEVAVLAALARIELVNRARDDFAFLLALAREVHAGADPAAVAKASLERAIRKRDLAIVVRVKRPEFQQVEDLVLEMMTKRLPDLGRMAAVEGAIDYKDLARRAFPYAEDARRVVAEQHAYAEQIVEIARRHPDLVRLPGSWVPSLALVAEDLIAWSRERAREEIALIYGPA